MFQQQQQQVDQDTNEAEYGIKFERDSLKTPDLSDAFKDNSPLFYSTGYINNSVGYSLNIHQELVNNSNYTELDDSHCQEESSRQDDNEQENVDQSSIECTTANSKQEKDVLASLSETLFLPFPVQQQQQQLQQLQQLQQHQHQPVDGRHHCQEFLQPVMLQKSSEQVNISVPSSPKTIDQDHEQQQQRQELGLPMIDKQSSLQDPSRMVFSSVQNSENVEKLQTGSLNYRTTKSYTGCGEPQQKVRQTCHPFSSASAQINRVGSTSSSSSPPLDHDLSLDMVTDWIYFRRIGTILDHQNRQYSLGIYFKVLWDGSSYPLWIHSQEALLDKNKSALIDYLFRLKLRSPKRIRALCMRIPEIKQIFTNELACLDVNIKKSRLDYMYL